MKDERARNKTLKEYIDGRRPVGRPRGRRIDAVENDAKNVLKCKNWRRLGEDRDAWRRRIEEAKAQVGL
jgi:hypothetical protein